MNDNGEEEVRLVIVLIRTQIEEFDTINAAIQANGGTPPPGSPVWNVARGETCDAVGALFAIQRGVKQQLDEVTVRGGSAAVNTFTADVATLRHAYTSTYAALEKAVDAYLNCWGMPPYDLATLPTDPELFAGLPIANQPGKVTMQRVLGAMVLSAEAKGGGAKQCKAWGLESRNTWL